MISPFLVAGDWKKVESLRFLGIREGLWIAPAWATITFPIARQWLYPLAGCFVSAILLKLRHLCEFSVCGNFPAENGQKAVLGASLADFPPFFSV